MEFHARLVAVGSIRQEKDAMPTIEGGCLCGAVRYQTQGEPNRITICHCRFCQRATGGAYMVEPIFRPEDVSVTRGVPSIYTHTSEGSGKHLHIHSCSGCATKLYVTFERFPDFCGIYGGTFDDPALVFHRGDQRAPHLHRHRASGYVPARRLPHVPSAPCSERR